MRKVIAAINMTIDGIGDHTAVTPDEEIHDHYTQLLANAGVLLYGRVTYQLMEYWRTFVDKPSGERSMDEFAAAMNSTPKIVFSNTLKAVDWDSARLATLSPGDEVIALRQQPGKDIYVGSPGLIIELTRLNLIDEYQLCVHPVIAGNGKPLFDHLDLRCELELIRTKTFRGGAVILYYGKKTAELN